MERIKATRKSGLLQFKCKWCGKIHIHGLGDGERASHCNEHTEDYYLVEVEE